MFPLPLCPTTTCRWHSLQKVQNCPQSSGPEGSEPHFQPPQERDRWAQAEATTRCQQEQSHSASNSHSLKSKGNNFQRKSSRGEKWVSGRADCIKKAKVVTEAASSYWLDLALASYPMGVGLSRTVAYSLFSASELLGVKQVVRARQQGGASWPLALLSPKLVALGNPCSPFSSPLCARWAGNQEWNLHYRCGGSLRSILRRACWKVANDSSQASS